MIIDPLSAKKIIEGKVSENGGFKLLFKAIDFSEAFRGFLVK
ncbi:hypothetical protein RV07_GL001356 [Enterococcus malodoratus]|nr:hypothetical protein RV07_GL001356 [Enterococcus malodoratus]